jgi:hypothetical protein
MQTIAMPLLDRSEKKMEIIALTNFPHAAATN